MTSDEFARVFRASLRAKELERRERAAFLAGGATVGVVMLVLFFVALVAA